MYAKPQNKEEASANSKFTKAINPFKKDKGGNGPRLLDSGKKLEWDDIDKIKRLERM